MLNGKSFMKNYRRFMMLVPILSFLNSPLEILPLNGSQIEAFSALVELPTKILPELPNQLGLYFKPQLIMSQLMCLELVEGSKKNKLELKDTIFSKSVLM